MLSWLVVERKRLADSRAALGKAEGVRELVKGAGLLRQRGEIGAFDAKRVLRISLLSWPIRANIYGVEGIMGEEVIAGTVEDEYLAVSVTLIVIVAGSMSVV